MLYPPGWFKQAGEGVRCVEVITTGPVGAFNRTAFPAEVVGKLVCCHAKAILDLITRGCNGIKSSLDSIKKGFNTTRRTDISTESVYTGELNMFGLGEATLRLSYRTDAWSHSPAMSLLHICHSLSAFLYALPSQIAKSMTSPALWIILGSPLCFIKRWKMAFKHK